MTVSLCNVTFQYPGRTLFRDMTVTLSPGAVHWIAGPNGSGKSTFLKMLCGYLLPSGGDILLNGRNLSDIPDRVRAGMVGVLPQIPLYALDFTVEETIRIGCSAKLPRFAPIPDTFRKKMEEAIEYFGLKELRNVPVNRLSGGERQKAALASVYALSPDILLLDEPTSALDPGARNHAVAWMNEYAKDHTVIAVTHDFELLGRAEGGLLLLDRAGSFLSGAAEDLLTSENLSRIYDTPAVVEHSASGHRWIHFD
jgi:iron complex transport system ATP-binding protein